MSITFSIACKKCKKHLWIAQGWNINDGHVYSSDFEIMTKLFRFLFAHKGHDLIFEDNCNKLLDYEEIE